MDNIKKLSKFVICICIIMAIILSYSLLRTIYTQNINEFNFCLQSRCVSFFKSKITGVIELAEFFGWLITLITAVGGAIIALRAYVSGVENSNITNHIAHFTLFKDFVNSEIMKKKKIHPDTVDVHFWYNTIFPNSKKGDLNYNAEYSNKIYNIKRVIDEANHHIECLTEKYKYKTHQRKMIDAVSEIGIGLSNGPKNIFTDIEPEVFALIDSVNTTFIQTDVLLCLINRKYI